MTWNGLPAPGLRRAFAGFCVCAWAVSPGEAGAPPPVTWKSPGPADPWHRIARPSADPAISARHLPAGLEIKSEAQLRLFRTLAAGVPSDSTRHWEMKGGRLRISYDMLQDLSGGNLPNTGGALGARLAAFLNLANGMDFQSAGPAFGTYLPNDKWLLGSPQWALHNTGTSFGDRPGKAGVDIDIERVWDKFSGSDSLVVAVVDAGFDFNHPDLKGKNWVNQAEAHGLPGVDDDHNGYVDDSVGWDFVENDNLPQDCHGHGTYVSSVIAAGFDNQEGIAGILAQGKIMPVRVLDASGHGDQSQIAQGILYAIKNGAKVINFSIGGSGDNLAMRGAFQTAQNAGVPIVVAAGNDGADISITPDYPASYTFDNLLVVAAHDHAGLLCGFSNYGKTQVHLAAPGELILVAGLPPRKEIWKEDFEAPALAWTTGGSYALSTGDSAEGKQTMAWVSGNNVSAVAPDTVDLTGSKGGVLSFWIDFKPANFQDVVIVEGNKQGTAQWTELAVIQGSTQPGAYLEYGLQDLDGSKFKLRFRTSLSTRYSAAARVLKLDAMSVSVPDPNPPKEPVYTVVAGTSLAAPHVTAYVGLQRLACDRMGLPWNRARALTGVVPESSLMGKVSSNGRLDAYKGLEFYLKTLPDFQLLDSTVRIWKDGQKVAYDLTLSPSPAQPYAFSATGLPDGAVIDGAGMLTWTPGPQQSGEYGIRLKAEGPTVLRKYFSFLIQPAQTVSIPLAAVPYADNWRWGGQTFRLRPGLAEGRHLVEVFRTDAAGKSQLLKRNWMEAASFRRPQALPSAGRDEGGAVIMRLQIRVDGIYLASAG